jgi:hypothetical protein
MSGKHETRGNNMGCGVVGGHPPPPPPWNNVRGTHKLVCEQVFVAAQLDHFYCLSLWAVQP